MRTCLVLSLAACGGGDTTPSTPAADPVALAGAVSQSELTTSIQGLEALETRFTMGQGDDRAKDYLVGRFAAMGLTAELDPFPVAGETVRDVLDDVFARFPGLRPRTLDPAGRLFPYLLLFRNGAELPRDGLLDASVGPDDVIELVGAAEGG